MKRLILCGLISISSLLAFGQVDARVERIIDADTYVLRIDGESTTCRLANIDAPELKQAYGLKAKLYVEELFYHKNLKVQITDTDFYGRSIVEVETDQGALDSLLVANGYAWHYAKYSQKPALQNLMEKAIEKRIGLWQCGKEKVCPPWLFRGYNKRNRQLYCQGCGR